MFSWAIIEALVEQGQQQASAFQVCTAERNLWLHTYFYSQQSFLELFITFSCFFTFLDRM